MSVKKEQLDAAQPANIVLLIHQLAEDLHLDNREDHAILRSESTIDGAWFIPLVRLRHGAV